MVIMKAIRQTDRLVQSLMHDILCARLPEGAALPGDDQLSAQFQVSRTVIRESFRILGAKGMLEARPRRGTMVAPKAAWAMWDRDVLAVLAQTDRAAQFDPHITDMRAAIEPALAALAASRADASHLTPLQDSLRALQQAPAPATEQAYLGHIFALSGNPFAGNALNLTAWACQRVPQHIPLAAYAQLTVAVCQKRAEDARRFALQAILYRVTELPATLGGGETGNLQ